MILHLHLVSASRLLLPLVWSAFKQHFISQGHVRQIPQRLVLIVVYVLFLSTVIPDRNTTIVTEVGDRGKSLWTNSWRLIRQYIPTGYTLDSRGVEVLSVVLM